MKTDRMSARSTLAYSPHGLALLRDPLLNKGTAFTEEEREALGLRGFLPATVLSMQAQVERVLTNLRTLPSDLEKYVALNSLHDRNEALFFRVVCDHIDEIQPLIYTPTVGLACQKYGLIFQRPRGLFISYNDRGRIAEILSNWPYRTKLIVMTDGERILGLGDLGANGMGIPVGKLSLYTACAGVHPEQCLPVMLDVGTNNEEFLNDPYYIGLRQRRVTGAAYDEFVDEFVTAARAAFPGVLIQFEDFANHSAFRLLHRYRDEACVFNDDIQGTAAVALAGIFSALRTTGGKLREQTLLFLGAGEAATGIADLVVSAMMAEGLSEAEALRRNWLVDSRGLVVKDRPGLSGHKLRYAHEQAPISDFLSAIHMLKPTAIVGVAAVGGAFTPAVLQAMAKLNGANFVPRQGNNSYIFPGVGLGAIASGSRLVTNEMFMAAAHTLANSVSVDDLRQGSLYPALPRIREVSAQIGAAVADVAYQRGLAAGPPPNDTIGFIQSQMYDPRY